MVASGGADGSVAIWKDCTDLDRIAAAQEAEDIALKEQDLDNAIHSGEWTEAAKLAIDMNRPGQLLRVFQRALNLGPENAAKIFMDVSKALDAQQTKTCLEYCREWNTHSKHCAIGQALLNAILKTHSQSDLISIPGCGSILDGIDAYTTRHLARIDRLSKSSFIVDFILGVMGSLVDDEEMQKADANYDISTLTEKTHEKKTRKRERA
jgi:U3 small nucleolar RNA-associated protein 13